LTIWAQVDGAGTQIEVEVRRHSQHVTLGVPLQERAEPGAVAIHLVAAHEVQDESVSERVGQNGDGQFTLGAELQIQRQAGPQ
jgi:hypothetical protein